MKENFNSQVKNIWVHYYTIRALNPKETDPWQSLHRLCTQWLLAKSVSAQPTWSSNSCLSTVRSWSSLCQKFQQAVVDDCNAVDDHGLFCTGFVTYVFFDLHDDRTCTLLGYMVSKKIWCLYSLYTLTDINRITKHDCLLFIKLQCF